MSQYSEMMGSFIRTGNYPIEANYIFPTLENLNLFYEDEINKTTIHTGLLRVVEDEKALYWAVPKEDGTFSFEKLIDINTISNIEELKEKLALEIQDRIDGDTAIWGTLDPTQIDQELNTILKIANTILDIKKDVNDLFDRTDTLKEELQAVVGTNVEDIIDYINSLDYGNLTKISETLHYFLEEYDESKDTIDTLPELQAFLEGFTDKDTLLLILTDLWHNILGDPLPNTLFRTLRGIQDFVEALSSYSKNRMNNIQKELDLTQVGVGLSGDGAYNADQETYYLKNATSVMNALKILDSLINEAINNCHYESEDSETVKIDIKKEPEKTTIKAWVKVSPEPGNDIVAKEDGIYHNIDSEYKNGILTIKVNGNIRLQHVLGLSSIVENAYYDPDLEAIVIIFRLLNGEKQTITIPTGALILEWDVDNSISTKVVELNKERVLSGGVDKLSADVRISTNKYNILEKDANTLLVRGTADNIIYDGDVTVKSKLDQLVTKDSQIDQSLSNLNDNLNQEINRAKEAERDIKLALDEEIQRSTDRDELLTSLLIAETKRAKDAEKILTDDLKSLDTKVQEEITRAVTSEHEISVKLQSEIDRSIDKDELLDHRIDDLKELLDLNTSEDSKLAEKVNTLLLDLIDEIDRASKAENVLEVDLSTEVTRAKHTEESLLNKITTEITESRKVETDLANKLTAEIDRSTIKDELLTKSINDEINRALDAELELQNNIAKETLRATNKEELLDRRIDDLKEIINNNLGSDDELKGRVSDLEKGLTEEINRALLAELDLANKITNTNTNLTNEIERAKNVENTLTNSVNEINNHLANTDSKLEAEITRSTTKDSELLTLIETEVNRASNTESAISLEVLDLIVKCICSKATTASEALNELAKLGEKYSTVEEIGKTLKAFLEDSDFADSTINKWQEIESFLLGITDLDTLADLLNLLAQTNKADIEQIRKELAEEINRAKLAEQDLQNNINLETERATNAETLLDHKIDDIKDALNNEINRSVTKDEELTKALEATNTKLESEIKRSTDTDIDLQKLLDLETLRATNAENNLSTNIKTVETVIKETINVRIDTLQDSLNQEISRSVLKDSELDDRLNNVNISLNNEITRAESAENVLSSRIDNVESSLNTSNTAITDISTKLLNEITRSIAKDQALEDSINREKDRAIAAEIALNEKITSNKNSCDTELLVIKEHITDLTDDLSAHILDTNNPHKVTKELIGLNKVDNTSDLEKPISVAVLDALNTINIEISKKAEQSDFLDHILNNLNPHNVTKEQIGLGNVDNTSDMNKPISLATLEALDKKSDVGHKHVMSDIADLENLPIVKGVIELLTELPTDPKNGEKWLLKTQTPEANARYEIVEYDAVNLRWNLKLLTTGGITCVIDGDVYKLNSSGLERMLDVSDYLYFYNKIYDETKDLIEDIDWEENDAVGDTNQQIRLKITYKTKYGDPNEDEATNPYQAKAVKYIDIDKSRFLANAYSRPATQDDVNNGYATTVGEPLLILVMTTGDHVTISLKDSLNIYEPVDTPSIDMSVSDWTGTPSTSYKVSADVRIAETLGKTDAISLHILDSTEKGLYSTLHTTNTNSITLTPNYGTAGSLKSLTADLNINNSLNDNSDVLLTIDSSGLSAKIIWGEYD